MTLAKDVMTKDVLTVNPETTVLEAIDILIDKKISGLPVVDKDNNLVGIVTEKDFIQLLLDEGVSKNSKVYKYMTKKVKSFKDEDNVVDICEFLIDNPIRRVTITNNSGKLSGVISRRDVLKLILATLLSEKKSET